MAVSTTDAPAATVVGFAVTVVVVWVALTVMLTGEEVTEAKSAFPRKYAVTLCVPGLSKAVSMTADEFESRTIDPNGVVPSRKLTLP